VIFAEKLNNSPPSGFYHYRPTLNVLQPIKTLPSEAMRKVLLHMELTKACAPAFALLYVGVVAKMLVKYRHRGYRYALMEAGSMYQQADLIGQSLGLRNKLYSGFNDHEILKLIGLDNMTFLPLVIQSFGGKTCR
jgi:SagB-type dehydrogenase family enzyme